MEVMEMVACVNILLSSFAHSSVLLAWILQILYLPSQSKNNNKCKQHWKTATATDYNLVQSRHGPHPEQKGNFLLWRLQ